MTDPIRVAALQMVSTDDVARNLRHAGDLVAAAAARGARLVVLPEAFALHGGGRDAMLGIGHAECSPDGPLRRFLSDTARACGVMLVGGTIPVADARAESRVRAACFVHDANGRQVARYDKIHMFDVDIPDAQRSYRESDTCEPGEDLTCVPGPCGMIGLAVCYDLRFPAMFAALAARGMEVLVIPSAFTHATGKSHWHALLRARAIEHQVHVIAADQGGRHSASRETWGGSMILDPWGRVLASASTGEAVVAADLDPRERERVMQRIPVRGQQHFDVLPRFSRRSDPG